MRPSTGEGGVLNLRAARTKFDLSRHEPSPALAPFVERHWVVHWAIPDGEVFDQPMVPHPCVNVAIEPDLAAIHGIVTRRGSRRLSGRGRVVGTKFRPGAFRPFWDRPVHELNDRTIELDVIFGADATPLVQRVRACDDAEAVAHLDAALCARLPDPDLSLDLVIRAAQAVIEDTTLTRAADLAHRTGQSLRTLQRLFREYVGIGPKLMIRRARIHDAADVLESRRPVDLARLAADLGYCDQAHFTRAFKAEVGRAPGDFQRLCTADAQVGLALDRSPT